jgi:hypothetical protein
LLEELDPQRSVPEIRYSGDAESTYAHVAWSPLRVVFLWEQGWKYHNAGLIPFPISFPSLQEVLFSNENGVEHPEADEEYWSNYGRDSSSEPSPVEAPANQTEDEYWGQYATVQGTVVSLSTFVSFLSCFS